MGLLGHVSASVATPGLWNVSTNAGLLAALATDADTSVAKFTKPASAVTNDNLTLIVLKPVAEPGVVTARVRVQTSTLIGSPSLNLALKDAAGVVFAENNSTIGLGLTGANDLFELALTIVGSAPDLTGNWSVVMNAYHGTNGAWVAIDFVELEVDVDVPGSPGGNQGAWFVNLCGA